MSLFSILSSFYDSLFSSCSQPLSFRAGQLLSHSLTLSVTPPLREAPVKVSVKLPVKYPSCVTLIFSSLERQSHRFCIPQTRLSVSPIQESGRSGCCGQC